MAATKKEYQIRVSANVLSGGLSNEIHNCVMNTPITITEIAYSTRLIFCKKMLYCIAERWPRVLKPLLHSTKYQSIATYYDLLFLIKKLIVPSIRMKIPK